jgi:hypothetical protein
MAEFEQKHAFPAISGFRLAVPPDRSDLLVLELATMEPGIIRFSMTRESALSFSDEIAKLARS